MGNRLTPALLVGLACAAVAGSVLAAVAQAPELLPGPPAAATAPAVGSALDAAPAGPVPSPAGAGAPGVPVVDGAWLTATSARSGVPSPALDAYARAQLRIADEQPSCRLGWTTLAGIGWVESHHGTIGGRTLLSDGRPSRPILGPELDGSGNVRAIPATPESTGLHGNPDWEHAVGPLQFLSSSWQRWGGDGDGDGLVDPHDLDDAAWAAARYLCADGHDLRTAQGWSAAVFSYNHDGQYVRDVHAAATHYGRRLG